MLDESLMTIEIDKTLLYRTKRRGREDGLTPEERVAINLLWNNNQGVRVPILSKVFLVGKNTIYYKALTGSANSYPTTDASNSAAETRALIERLGYDEAYRQFVTPKMIQAVNQEMALEAARRQRRRRRKRK
jgi:hypothetical protein